MLYPLIKECNTEARVTFRNITVKNVEMHGGIFPPGIIRCNATNPCTGFHFENINVTGWFTEKNIGFITENVFGTAINVFPDPGFNQASSNLNEDWVKEMLEGISSQKTENELLI